MSFNPYFVNLKDDLQASTEKQVEIIHIPLRYNCLWLDFSRAVDMVSFTSAKVTVS